MKFKSILSPKQFFNFKGQTYRANEGLLIIDDKEVIEYLLKAPYWTTDEKVKVEPKVEAPKVEPKKVTKKGAK